MADEKATTKSESPAGGAATDDKTGYFADLVTHSALRDVAEAIVQQGLSSLDTDAEIVIVDSLQIAQDDVTRLQVTAQLDLYEQALAAQTERNNKLVVALSKVVLLPLAEEDTREILKAEPPATEEVQPAAGGLIGALTGIPGLVSAVSDVVGYFRTSYDVKGREVNIKSEALKAALAGAIVRHQHKLVRIPGFGVTDHSVLIDRFSALVQQRAVGLEQSKNKLQSRIDALDPKKDSKDQSITDMRDAVNETDQLGKALDAFCKSMTNVPEGHTHCELAVAVQREQFMQNTDKRYLLYATLVSSAGLWWTKSSLLRFVRELFKPGQIEYGGGVSVSYVVAKASGEIVAADTLLGLSQMTYELPATSINIRQLLPTSNTSLAHSSDP